MSTVILPFNHPQFLLANPKNTIEVLGTAHLWRNRLGNTNVLSGLSFVGVAGTMATSPVPDPPPPIVDQWAPLTDDDISLWAYIKKTPVPFIDSEIEVVFPTPKNVKEIEIFMRNFSELTTISIYNNPTEDLLFGSASPSKQVRVFSPQPEGMYLSDMRIHFDYNIIEISEIRAFEGVYPPDIISIFHQEPVYGTTFSAFSAVSTIPANTQLEYIIHVNNTRYWFDGNKWRPQGNILRFDRTNTEAEVNANIASINTTGRQIRLDVEVLLQTNDEYATPDITSVSLEVA